MLFRILVREGAMVLEVREGSCSSVSGSSRRMEVVLVLQTDCIESICFSTGSRREEARSRIILTGEMKKTLQL